LLGAPTIKEAGILFLKKIGEKITEGESLFKLFSNSQQRIDLALQKIEEDKPFEIV